MYFLVFPTITQHSDVVDPIWVQSGASSRAKHGGAYFSAVSGSIEDLGACVGQNKR